METAASLTPFSGRGIHRYRLRRSRGKPTVSIIYSPGEFRAVINRECERAERYQLRFSLAVFEVGTHDESSLLIRRLVRTIHHRFRNTDDIGWYRPGQIGMILPFTPSEGAWKLAEDVSEVVESITNPPPFAIYSFPSSNWPERRISRRISSFLGISTFFRRLLTIPVPPSEEFHAMIARERGRSDRNGNLFSLIVFKMQNLPPGISTQRRILLDLNSRLRDTDEIGWYDERHLGAILPYAGRPDALRIAESVCRNIGVVPGSDHFSVYTYPENWFPDRKPAELELSPRLPASTSPSAGQAGDAGEIAGKERKDVVDDQDNAGYGKTFMYRRLPLWKRILDILGSLVAVSLLSPLFLFAVLVVKCSSPGPVLFRQKRIGYMGRPFLLFKFRTMEVNAETMTHSQYMRKLIVEDSESKPMTKIEQHPGIIRGGRLLRSSCIDELPQLFNVLLGQMSLIGPRPCLPYEADEYLRWHTRRFDSLPGMTGLWQVTGKNRTTFKEMIRLDILYAQKRSLRLDFKILCLTPVAIFRQLLEQR